MPSLLAWPRARQFRCTYLAIASTALLAVACGGSGTGLQEPAAGAGCAPIDLVPANYAFAFQGSPTYTGTEATWNRSTRVVRLGPEDTPEDLGSLTLVLAEPEAAGTGCLAFPIGATLSTSDVAVGTGPEINGKLYGLVAGNCGNGPTSVVIVNSLGQDQLTSLNFCVRLQRSLSDGSGEIIEVQGQFAARSD